MKYKHILNGQLLFETNNASEYFQYLLKLEDHNQTLYSVLYNLLEKSKEYECDMATK